MTTQSDEKLVESVQKGDILAFEILVKKYQNRLVSFSYRIVRDRDTAQETAQDALFKVYQSIDRVDISKKFSTYLFEVTKNTAISRLRQEKQELPLTAEIIDDEKGNHLEEIIKNQELSRVRQVVKSLPSHYKRVVSLYYFDDLSYEEISQKLKIPVNTVRTHLRRAKQNLKTRLSG